MFNTGCKAPATAVQSEDKGAVESSTSTPCAETTKTVTSTPVIGVWHKAGHKFVLIHPSLKSAHYDKSKHSDDVIVYGAPVTSTVTTSAAASRSGDQGVTTASTTTTTARPRPLSTSTQVTAATQAATSAATPASGVAGLQATQTQTPAAAPAAGAVAGETAALPQTKAKPAGGVLGATTRLGGTVASSNLPFTGLPLWIFAAAAAGLILVGFTVRRSSTDRL